MKDLEMFLKRINLRLTGTGDPEINCDNCLSLWDFVSLFNDVY